MSSRRAGFALIGLLAVAVGLRVVGIGFGGDAGKCRPDEEFVVDEAVYLSAGDPHVHFHHYPPALTHAVAALFGAGRSFGWLSDDPVRGFAQEPGRYRVTARCLVAILGALTVALVYFAGRALIGPAGGLAAALVVATSPLHVLHSHFATLDVPGVFAMSLATALSLTALSAERGRTIALGAAGAAAGVALVTKYPHGAVIIAPLLVAVTAPGRARALAVVIAGCIVGGIAVAPSMLYQFPEFLDAMGVEASSQDLRRDQWDGPHPLIYHVQRSLFEGTGSVWLITAALGMVMAVIRARGDRRFAVALAVVVVPVLVIAGFHGFQGAVFQRYALPAFPAIGLLTGALLPKRPGALVWVGLLALASLPALRSVAIDRALLRADTRDELVRAFADGVLPTDLPVLMPRHALFGPFPRAMNGTALALAAADPASALGGCDERARIVGEASAAELASDHLRLAIIPYARGGDAQALAGFSGRQVLMIIPETFDGLWKREAEFLDDVLKVRLPPGSVEVLLDLDPRRDGSFVESAYDPLDLWFVPISDPDAALRPGPRIRVVRVRVPKGGR